MIRRIRSFTGCFAALLAASAPTFANTDVTLQLDVVDPTHYGNKHPDSFVRITSSLNISFTTVEPGQATLFLTAYDIDYSDEVLVTLPDGSATFLNAPINSNQHSPDVAVPLGNLAAGTHEIAIQNNRNPNYKWGVSDLRVTQSEESVSGDHALALVIELGCDPGQFIVATTLGFECAEGAQGPEGPRGVPGTAGENGIDGAAGIAGANGEDGVNGEDGADGKDGEVGPQGPAGPPGQSPGLEEIIAAVELAFCNEGEEIVRLDGGQLLCQTPPSQCDIGMTQSQVIDAVFFSLGFTEEEGFTEHSCDTAGITLPPMYTISAFSGYGDEQVERTFELDYWLGYLQDNMDSNDPMACFNIMCPAIRRY